MDNYKLQLSQAKKHFLTYDQQELIQRTGIRFDEDYFYLDFLGSRYRVCRKTGDMERKVCGFWCDGNGFGEVMTILDWLCDSSPDRFVSGNWVNIVSQGHYFHSNLQDDTRDPDAEFFNRHRDRFGDACKALGGQRHPSADEAYTIELLDGLPILVQLWYGDEEFPPRLRCLWDENALRYLRYETTWFAVGFLMQRLRQKLPLVTERLILRPWQGSDAEALYEYARDPQIGPAAGWPVHTDIENSREILAKVLCVPETYAVCRKTDGKAIGSIGLKTGSSTDMTDRSDECELGYWLGKPHWGQGIIPEAAEELLRHAFQELGMRSVWCGYYDGNEKSHRVQEKLGFVYHHTTQDLELPLLGERRTGHSSLLTKKAWEERQNQK